MHRGDVTAFPLPFGGWGAAVVTGTREGVADVCALRWYSEEPPALADLAGAGPLVLDHHNHGGRLEHVALALDEPVPPGWRPLGRLPVPPGVPEHSGVSTGWASLPLQVYRQRRWDLTVPAAVKEAYRAAATRGWLELDLGDGPRTLAAPTTGLDLTGVADVNWAEVDRLHRCTGVAWAGPDRGLTAALAARPMITRLDWRDPPAAIDLSGTALDQLRLAGAVRELRLPPRLESLTLDAAAAAVPVVHAAEDGRWIGLFVDGAGPDTVLPAGLRALRGVTLAGAGTLSAATVAALPELERLDLNWAAAPGALTAPEALAGHAGLAQLALYDAYDLRADTLPELPALAHLTVHGLRRSAVAGLRTRYRGIRLVIRGAKNDTWLAANLDNPLRDWVDDDERAGAAACKAYAAAVRAIGKGADPEPAFRAFVTALNRVDARYHIIDTLRREQAGDAFMALAARAGVEEETADAWFDEWRDF